jgi:hypothetical protein
MPYDGRDSAVDAFLDEEGYGESRDVLDDDEHAEQHEGFPEWAQQRSEEASRPFSKE